MSQHHGSPRGNSLLSLVHNPDCITYMAVSAARPYIRIPGNSHYNYVIMTTVASQITSRTVIYSTVCSHADQRKHQSSASLAFVWGIHRDRWIPRTKGQLRGKCFHLMTSSCGVIFIYRLWSSCSKNDFGRKWLNYITNMMVGHFCHTNHCNEMKCTNKADARHCNHGRYCVSNYR